MYYTNTTYIGVIYYYVHGKYNVILYLAVKVLYKHYNVYIYLLTILCYIYVIIITYCMMYTRGLDMVKKCTCLNTYNSIDAFMHRVFVFFY